MVAFRSLLVPVQAAVTNLLSVAAALGVLTAVFQWGWGLSLIGLDAPAGTVPIASFVPLMMFAVLFGLSMDYEVFLVSRIQQHHAEGEEPRQAVDLRAGCGRARGDRGGADHVLRVLQLHHQRRPDREAVRRGPGGGGRPGGPLVVTLAPALLTLFGRGVFWVPRVPRSDPAPPRHRRRRGHGGGPGSRGARYPPSGRGPMSAAPPAASSARMMCISALICARWVNAWGKFPQWRPVRGSISSA